MMHFTHHSALPDRRQVRRGIYLLLVAFFSLEAPLAAKTADAVLARRAQMDDYLARLSAAETTATTVESVQTGMAENAGTSTELNVYTKWKQGSKPRKDKVITAGLYEVQILKGGAGKKKADKTHRLKSLIMYIVTNFH